MDEAQDPGPFDLYLFLCRADAAHEDSRVRFSQSGTGEFRALSGARIRGDGHPRECSFSRQCGGGKFAESFRRGPSLSGVRAAGFAGPRDSPESIADAFVFLCSPLASEINGQVLSADYGGGIGNRL